MSRQHDFDWLVIGSGFGGSVSALRLSEKGYSVGVLEAGRRFDCCSAASSGARCPRSPTVSATWCAPTARRSWPSSAKNDEYDFSTNTVAITSSIYPDPDTHIEPVTYGRGGDSMTTLFTLLTGDGTRLTRPLRLLATIARHPVQFVRQLSPLAWSRRTMILLVMQTLDNSMRLRPKRGLFGGLRLQTEQDPDNPNPTFIPVANEAAQRIAEKIGGIPQSGITEALLNTPTTAHILGGAVIGADSSTGVVDRHLRVFGYENLMVCDGAAVPANVGVNPSLTITALAEWAMGRVPAAGAPAPEPDSVRLEQATIGSPVSSRPGEAT